MAKQARDVTGGTQTWGRMIPGYGMFNYALGLFSVPIESFIRFDFGERYYSKGSFFGGLVVLIIFNFVSPLIAWILERFPSVQAAESDNMSGVLFWYCVVGLGQFSIIWIRDAIGQPRHSYESGRSILTPVGKGIMKVMNLAVGIVIRIIAAPMPSNIKDRMLSSLPIIRDSRTFTERFIEPVAVFFAANYCLNTGQLEMFLWLVVSFFALNFSTSNRHEQERNYVLDMRDQMIEARFWQEIIDGKSTSSAEHLRRTVSQTMSEVEKNPEIFETIKETQPTVARAIAAVRARQQKAPLSESDAFGSAIGAV